ncbi:MAG: YkgJ family cysteine cluster protein [Thermodesulfobacteriota bacterium]
MKVNGYIENRTRLFKRDSEFSCPDQCNRFGCKDEGLHISVSIVDLVAASLQTGEKTSDLFRAHYKIGASPMEENPWIQRFVLELKKPCPFLTGKDCGIYGGRPITCALFPEAFFLFPEGEGGLDDGKFGHYPCLQEPLVLSEKRRSHLIKLMEMSRREALLTEFYLFGFSPFSIDLRNSVIDLMEVSRDISGSIGDGERPYKIPHEAFEKILVRRLGNGGYLSGIDSKVDELNSTSGIEALLEIKEWTDLVVADDKDFPYCYEFAEGDRLKLVKRLI